MRFYTKGLSKQYVYPCSKAGVKAAFGDELLGSVCFGITSEFRFEPRYSPRPKILGTVIMALAVREPSISEQLLDQSSLYIYRVLGEEFSELTHRAVAELMKGPMRDWLDSHLDRPETEVFGADRLLVELRTGQLVLHETCYR